MTPSDSRVLTDDDLAAWADDLRRRLDAVAIAVPDVADVVSAPRITAHRRGPAHRSHHRRLRPTVLVALAAALALLVGATIVLTRDHRTKVSTQVGPSDDPLDGVVLLGPPDPTAALSVHLGRDLEIQDPDGYDGRIENYVGGQTGGPARLVSLMSAAPGARQTPYSGVAGMTSLDEWFDDDLRGTPAHATVVPVDVPGATKAVAVDLDTPLNDLHHHTRFVAAQTAGVNVVLAGTGVDLDTLTVMATHIRLADGSARFDTAPDGLTPIGSPDGSRRWSSTYSVQSTVSIEATPVDDASAAIAAVHSLEANSDAPDDLVVDRSGPDWVLSLDDTMGTVLGVRDGLWIRLMGMPDGRHDPVARIDGLTPMSRARFDRLTGVGDTATDTMNDLRPEVRAVISDHGNWLPTRLPESARLTRVSLSGVGTAPSVVGLPALWNPTTGGIVRFNPGQEMGGIVIEPASPAGSHLVELTRLSGDLTTARVWPTTDPASTPITVHARGVDVGQVRSIATGLRWTDANGGRWSATTPPGWEAIPGTDRPHAASDEVPGYGLDLGVVGLTIVFADAEHQVDGLLNFLESGTATRSTLDDGQVVYTSSRTGVTSVYLPGTDGRPDLTAYESRLPLDDLIDVLLSVRPTSPEEADEFLAPVSAR